MALQFVEEETHKVTDEATDKKKTGGLFGHKKDKKQDSIDENTDETKSTSGVDFVDNIRARLNRDKALDLKSFSSYELYKKLKPKQDIAFFSDYFVIDKKAYCCILDFYHKTGARDGYPMFWGVNLIPSSLEDGVVFRLVQNVDVKSDKWVDAHSARAERVAEKNAEDDKKKTAQMKHTSGRINWQLQEVATQLADGAAYVHYCYRALIKAPSLEALDRTCRKLSDLYKSRFGTLYSGARTGTQRHELTTLLSSPDAHDGKGFYAPSKNFAGTYNLVTHGIEDIDGEYVGVMTSDVNNAAILINLDQFDRSVTCATNTFSRKHSTGRVRTSWASVWGTLISEAALADGHRVIHIVLDRTDVSHIGMNLRPIEAHIDMAKGAVNPFQFFGTRTSTSSRTAMSEMEQKLNLIAHEMYQNAEPAVATAMDSIIGDVIQQFYTDKRMWFARGDESRQRLFELPNIDYPRLRDFTLYLEDQTQRIRGGSNGDIDRIRAINGLQFAFDSLQRTHADLFNKFTDEELLRVGNAKRIIYDFGDLNRRGANVFMCQLINVFGLAVDAIDEGDVLIIHGMEVIEDSVKKYIKDQLTKIEPVGGRVVYCYSNFDALFADYELNHYNESDYIVLSCMTEPNFETYQEQLGQPIPSTVRRQICLKDPRRFMIRRGFDNVIFHEAVRL